jgi:tetratricopeptide (TPR) repeat protein
MLAHKDFEQAIRLAPKDEDAWHNLSVTLRYFGRKAESAAAAKKAARLGWHLP